MRIIIAGLTALAATVLPVEPVRAYDMDCKVILCLAGGFPTGCGDAKSYMMRRLKKKKPPFGPCSGDDGDYTVPVKMFSRAYPPRCTAWGNNRDGRYCMSRTAGRSDYVISITIPEQHEPVYQPEYTGEYVWFSMPWHHRDK